MNRISNDRLFCWSNGITQNENVNADNQVSGEENCANNT